MRTTPHALVERYRRAGWWSDQRIFDLFDVAVRARPDATAVVDPPNRTTLIGGTPLRLSYAQLDRLAMGFARRLMELGFERDDVLITQLPNVAEYVAVYLAAMKLGVVLSPAPMQFRRRELAQILQLTGARGLLTVPRLRNSDPCIEARAAVADGAAMLLCLGSEAPAGTVAIDPVLALHEDPRGNAAAIPVAQISADDVVTICWTSGTEGAPKGVPRTHNQWLAISHAHFEGAGIREGDVLLNPFPLINMAAIGGCFLSWLRAAGTLVLHHPLELPVYLAQIAIERPHYAIAPPAVLNMLLQDEQLLAATDLSSLRCIGSGSAPLDPAMIRGFRDRFGIEIVNMFGSNEGMSLVSSAIEAPEPERRARFFPRFGRPEVGWSQRVAHAIETRIVDPETATEILIAGNPGEMQIRGPTVFDGYFRAPEITSKAFTADGWFRTGDLFEIAGEGEVPRYYQFVGRLKQLIIRGGVKIAPDEIESTLALHPAVAEAGAIGYRDTLLGERVAAIVVLKTGAAPLTLNAVQNLFREQGLAVFKWPERLRFVDALPRNALGKVVRTELAEIAERQD